MKRVHVMFLLHLIRLQSKHIYQRNPQSMCLQDLLSIIMISNLDLTLKLRTYILKLLVSVLPPLAKALLGHLAV